MRRGARRCSDRGGSGRWNRGSRRAPELLLDEEVDHVHVTHRRLGIDLRAGGQLVGHLADGLKHGLKAVVEGMVQAIEGPVGLPKRRQSTETRQLVRKPNGLLTLVGHHVVNSASSGGAFVILSNGSSSAMISSSRWGSSRSSGP